MSSVFNESPLKSQAKSKFLSDYVTGGNVTVYWLIFIYTMNYEINNPQGRLIQILTWIKLRFSSYMGHVSTCTYCTLSVTCNRLFQLDDKWLVFFLLCSAYFKRDSDSTWNQPGGVQWHSSSHVLRVQGHVPVLCLDERQLCGHSRWRSAVQQWRRHPHYCHGDPLWRGAV